MEPGIIDRTVSYDEGDKEGTVMACSWTSYHKSDEAPDFGFWLLVMDDEGNLHEVEATDCTVLAEEGEEEPE